MAFKTNVKLLPNCFSQQDLRKTKSLMKSYTKWQLSKFNDENDQYQLDAGQKKFGATQCHECQVVYQIGDPEDEHVHLNYHNSIRVLKFNVSVICCAIMWTILLDSFLFSRDGKMNVS